MAVCQHEAFEAKVSVTRDVDAKAEFRRCEARVIVTCKTCRAMFLPVGLTEFGAVDLQRFGTLPQGDAA